jgi:hypothetical protein
VLLWHLPTATEENKEKCQKRQLKTEPSECESRPLISMLAGKLSKQIIQKYSVHFAGLLAVRNILSANIGISRQIEGHSFGDHLIS